MTHVPEPERQGSTIRRLAAGAAGAITLIATVLFSFGTVLAAPLGVLVARAFARRWGRPLSRGAAWLGAVSASIIALFLVVGGIVALAPAETKEVLRAAVDSAQAQEQKPAEMPKWLERISPQTPQQKAMGDRIASSRGFITFFGLIGLVMACSFFGTLFGSVGWVASMLFAYAFTGRWIRTVTVAPPIPLEE